MNRTLLAIVVAIGILVTVTIAVVTGIGLPAADEEHPSLSEGVDCYVSTCYDSACYYRVVTDKGPETDIFECAVGVMNSDGEFEPIN